MYDVRFSSAVFPAESLVLRLEGLEGLNSISRWVLELTSPEELELAEIIRTYATLTLVDGREGVERTVYGLVTALAFLGTDGNAFEYRVELRPREYLLEQCAGYRVLLGQTVPEMLTSILTEEGLGSDQLQKRLAGTYGPRPYTVQHGEPHWRFIERLLADEGISYWFDSSENGPLLVLGDSVEKMDDLSVSPELSFEESYSANTARHLLALEQVEATGCEGTLILDYDPRHPDVLVEGKAGTESLQHFEFPAKILRDLASDRAAVRLSQLTRDRFRVIGASDSVRVQAGRRLQVVGCADEELDGVRIVGSVRHHYARRGGSSESVVEYSNDFELYSSTMAARPDLPIHHRVTGIDLGITTGPGGEEIHVDDLGSVTLRFPWDRSGRTDDKSSYWSRTAQLQLAGSMLLPRVGWEVPVLYADGDPDFPIVLGRNYNPDTAPPYALPARKATTSFQSATSPGGGTTNELRMSDDAGCQEMYIHASRDQTVTVGGASTVDVALNDTHDVALSYSLGVLSDQTLTVGAKRAVSVGTDQTQTVEGARSELIGGLDLTKVSGDRLIDAGPYIEVVAGLYGIQCNQLNTDVGGGYGQFVSGKVLHTAGLGGSDTVAGNRLLKVGGAETIVAGMGYEEQILGKKTLTAGNVKIEASGAVGTSHKSPGKVTVGATARITASGTINITAPRIIINASGGLDAHGLKLKGGTFHCTRGSTLIDGDEARKGGTELK